MSISELFWIFLILTAIQPIIRQRWLDASRARLLRRIQRMRGSRVISLVHRQETMSLLGFPVLRYISIDDSEQVIRAIHRSGDDVPIDLVLHTPGGLVLASVQIARALARHQGKVTVFVPHYAMSGGTLIALAADEIVMSEHAALGPVDPQLGVHPAASLLRVAAKKPVDKLDDETLILADQAEMAVRQLRQTVEELLCAKLDAEACKALASQLSEGHWTHDYPILPEAAREMGLPVSTEMLPEIIELMALYPQPIRGRPSVEYVPQHRREAPPGRARLRPGDG
jgi:ClpP class serine protease